jgi:N-acetylglucosaminyldiphosphoundecaprenol N-acetyl-beta-D-mannosaminyltransferase
METMIDRGKHSVIGVRVDAVDYEEAVSRVVAAAHAAKPCSVSAMAVHGVVTASLDPSLRARVNKLDLVTPDGQPVRWAMNSLHGTRLEDRVYGPELTLRIFDRCAIEGLPVFFYGSTDRVLAALVRNVAQRFPAVKVAGTEASKFRSLNPQEIRDTAERIRTSGAQVCFVGLGCPRQEVFVSVMSDLLDMPMLAVGAAFDFHAGTLAQAPAWMQRRGLEWLYRLLREPRRLWRRYIFTNSYFCWAWLGQRLGRTWTEPDADHCEHMVPG